MKATPSEFERQCREHPERYFAHYPNGAMKALRFITASDEMLSGRPEGWAAGIVYRVANQDRQTCGVPGRLNSELGEFFGISMGTIRKRAARVEQVVAI
jgi:hypothetical protein